MQTRTTKRSLHPRLALLPLVLYGATLGSFVVYALTHSFVWWEVALGANVLGAITALVAAVPGAFDLFGASGKTSRVPPIGLAHMTLNLGALALFGANLVVQMGAWAAMPQALRALLGVVHIVKPDVVLALALSGSGLALTLVAGTFGLALARRHVAEARAARDDVRTAGLAGAVAPVLAAR